MSDISNYAVDDVEPEQLPACVIHQRSGGLTAWRQGRFASYPVDESWLLKAAAYVELNPVNSGDGQKARDYRWSSIKVTT